MTINGVFSPSLHMFLSYVDGVVKLKPRRNQPQHASTCYRHKVET